MHGRGDKGYAKFKDENEIWCGKIVDRKIQ